MLWHGGRTASFTLQSFVSFWKSSYILSFAYIPSTQSLNTVNPRPGFPERGFCSLRKGLPSLNLLRCPPRMAGPCSCGRTASSAPTASPTHLSAIGCRVLDRICTRLYLTQIARRSANGYRAMQLRILVRKGGVNACALARRTTASSAPAASPTQAFCYRLPGT